MLVVLGIRRECAGSRKGQGQDKGQANLPMMHGFSSNLA